ncbi:MAG: ATPase P, partial [Candidatus Omnitrophica bacterium]|nr:ATPase P [Candidatus Omnitrophota bacterium]
MDFDYKGCSKEALFEKFQTSLAGLSDAQAIKRLAEYGLNEGARKKKRTI